jgi:hypothetical protein
MSDKELKEVMKDALREVLKEEFPELLALKKPEISAPNFSSLTEDEKLKLLTGRRKTAFK